MSNLMLENGVYSVTQPIPSSITSGAVLMAENELFDQVYVKENTKNTKKISISDCNGTAVDSEDGTVDYHHYHRRKTSSAQELDPGEEATLYCSKRTKKNICNILVVISLIAVVCLYSLGIVFFYTNVPENENIDYETQSSALLNQLNQCKELVSLIISCIQVWLFPYNISLYTKLYHKLCTNIVFHRKVLVIWQQLRLQTIVLAIPWLVKRVWMFFSHWL